MTTIQLGLRINQELYNKIIKEAEQLGIKPSELIRINLAQKYKEEKK